nr:short transient receptor potential channel 4-like [Lytechinus pictus]
MEWKFGRAQLWLRVIEAKTDLPPPFNLIPKSGTVLRMIKRCVGKTPRSSEEDEDRSEDGERTRKDVIRKLLERYQDQRRTSTPSSGITMEDFRILKEDFRSLRNHISKILRLVEMSIVSLEDIVQGLNLRIDELEDTDTQLDGIDRNRVQIENDDIDQLIEDVTIFEKCVRRAMARLQSTSLITKMAEMYTQGRTVVNDGEMRGKLESYRKDFESYEKNLYA